MARLNAAWRVIKRFHWRCAKVSRYEIDIFVSDVSDPAIRLNRVTVANGAINIKGHSKLALLNFSTELEHQAAVPDSDGAFELVISGSRQLVLRVGTEGTERRLRLYGPKQSAINVLRTTGGLLSFLGQWRDIWAYIMQGDSAAGNRLEHRLAPVGPDEFVPAAHPALFATGSRPVDLSEPVDIIVPVYNAFDETSRCLDYLAKNTDTTHRIWIIEDASPDRRLAPLVRDWAAARSNAAVLENEVNQGFVTSVNRGLSQAQGHVVLLNSDAFVPPGWLPRLLAPILADETVASVTPMSSDAEIFTAPVECVRFVPEHDRALKMDVVAKDLNAASCTVEAPTGVGFCMALNQRFLEMIPQLDTIFGRGYGEEVDWCRKAHALGGRNLGIGNLYVEHQGGGSFGPEKLKQIRNNNRVINARYPGYDELVAQFRHHDPLIGPRLVLALASISADTHIPIYISQRLGGGSEHWLDKKICADIDSGPGCVVIRQFGLDENTLAVEVHCPSGCTKGRINTDELRDYLGVLPRKKFIYSCLVNAEDPLGLMDSLSTCIGNDDHFCVMMHDFFPLCPSYNLISRERSFCGLPEKTACQNCYSNLPVTSGRRPDTIRLWRSAWKKHMDRADEIFVFSADSRNHITEVWPDLDAKIVIQRHDLLHLPPKVAAPNKVPLVLGVLGSIGYAKGAAVLKDLAAETGKDFKIVVVGTVDAAFAHPALIVNGTYKHEDISRLAEKYGISGWFIPSIWPETFCFAAHECLATGLPVLSFDIGAQAEAMKAHPNGHILPLDASSQYIKDVFLQIAGTPR